MKICLISVLLLICSQGLYSQEYKLPVGLKYKKPKNSIDVTKTYKPKTGNQSSVIDESSDAIFYQIDDMIFKFRATEDTLKGDLLERFRTDDFNMKKQLGLKTTITEIQKNGGFSYYKVYRPVRDKSKMLLSSFIVDNSSSIFIGCALVFPVDKREKADVIFDRFISSLRYKKRQFAP
ncbi:hypothetical protein [Pedobacter sp. JY14-1]|uniref:hypothetical protein n=1 Tax=Pedobacter sp. JY14-1 TaxID=3034151 RepID=UPI0023E1CAB7|nr:hypothetical protein [Pedobacter sp. JY14-1]